MAHIRASFEKQLKQKLSLKSSPHISEENVLIKAFKYFDLNNSGTVEKSEFIKVIEKIGILIQNKQDFDDLFEYYDNNGNGSLDYKEFTGMIFGNQSANTRQFSPPKTYLKASVQGYRGYSQQDAVLRFQKKLLERGASGILGIARQFRIFDDDGSRTLNKEEFIKACKDFQIGLDFEEIEDVFNYFDKNKNGVISYDEFLLGLRGPLNQFRRKLVHDAFRKLDKDGSGIVELNDLKGVYNGKMHPDVRSGKRTEDSVLLEFLTTFENYSDYTGKKDGKVTFPEFEDYYTFISASIDNDAYFELMINNVWRINEAQNQVWEKPGYVQEIRYSPNKSVLRTPQQSERPNSSVALQKSNIFKDNIYPNQFQTAYQAQYQKSPQQNLQEQFKQVSQKEKKAVNPYDFEPIQQTQQQQIQQISQQQQPTLYKHQSDQQKEFHTEELIRQIRQKLATRGTRGFIGIQRQFRIMDDDFDRAINYQEFRKALRDYKINLNEDEMTQVFQHIDRDGSGKLSIEELARVLQGDMNEFRKNLVLQAFSKLDSNQDGIININDIKGIYSAKNNPEVKSGKKTENEVLGEFLETFELHHNLKAGMRDQKVTKDEFLEYYNNVSASIDNDQYFELLMVNSYKLYETNQQYQVFAPQGRYYNQKQSEYRSNVTINAPFGTSNIPTDYSTNLRPISQQIQNKSQVQFGTATNVPAGMPSWPGYSLKQKQALEQQKPQSSLNVGQTLINAFRQKIFQRGVRGIFSIGRMFRIVDDDNSRNITLEEFNKCLKDLRLGFTPEEGQQLFQQFDRDGSGRIDYNEFLKQIRGQMNQKRRELTLQAFKLFDKDGNGVINVDDLRNRYDARLHPDVRTGKKSEEQVLGEFLDSFEIHHALATGNQKGRDQVVTLDEFIEYYDNISASIDDDRYFELMIKTAWNMDGQKTKQPGWKGEI